LRNSPPDYDLYDAFSSLVNLDWLTISLDSDTVHEIPDYAFGKSNQPKYLSEIYIHGNGVISRIGNYAFYNLPSIRFIFLSSNSIQYISAHAFDLQFSNDDRLYIYLTGAQLDENCLESGVFQSPLWKIYLSLSIDTIIYFYFL
jgi:hypothetical protein